MPDRDFFFGYFFARQSARPWRGRKRTRPKMPSTTWRLWALVCVAVGVLVSWLIDGSSGWRLFGGGVIGFLVGMYIVETIWERRLRADATNGPIGRRR